jgi:hypothetical protein
MAYSQSSIKTWFQCPRLWRYTYVDGVEPVAPPSREQRFGTAFHKLLENLWTDEPAIRDEIDLPSTDKFLALTLIEAYQRRYTLPKQADMLGAEVPFQIGESKGVFDGVFRRRPGISVVEHKTTSSDFSVDDVYWERVKQDWQVGIYQLAARELYQTDDVEVLYDVIRVPQQRQKRGESPVDLRQRIAEDIAENPDRYFGQARIRWSDQSLQRLQEDLHAVKYQIDFAKSSFEATDGSYPRSRKCHEYRRPCAFIPVCFGDSKLSDERLYQPRSKK